MENGKLPKDIFVDGIANVSYNSGAFRFELVSIDPSVKDKKGNPGLTHQARIVMTPQGFIQTANAMQQFLQQVEEKGIIHRSEIEEKAKK